MNDKFLDLYNSFLGYVEKNDEEGARKFLIDNLSNFPEEVRDKLTFAFFEEALMKKTNDINDISEIQEQGVENIKQIDKAKKILEDKAKIETLRSNLIK